MLLAHTFHDTIEQLVHNRDAYTKPVLITLAFAVTAWFIHAVAMKRYRAR